MNTVFLWWFFFYRVVIIICGKENNCKSLRSKNELNLYRAADDMNKLPSLIKNNFNAFQAIIKKKVQFIIYVDALIYFHMKLKETYNYSYINRER